MCGPGGFMNAVKENLSAINFDMSHFHMESFGGLRTSVKNKPAPIPSGNQSTAGSNLEQEALSPTGELKIEFANSGKTVQCDTNTNLLDIAEANDVDIDYACRAGSCGACKVKLLKGSVDQEYDDGLDEAEKQEGYILTCVSIPKTNCTLDV